MKNKRSPLKVGLTGGIGSGKTTVSQIFKTMGIPVYDADQHAKRILAEEYEVKKKVIALLGSSAYSKEGKLNREYIAANVFGNKGKLRLLNAIVHPAVAKDSLNWHRQQKDVPYTIKEAALIYEAGSVVYLDKVITVAAPYELRINRTMSRDDISREEVLARMKHQLPQEEKVERADFVILNDRNQMLIPQIVNIHRQLVAEFKQQ